MTYQEILSLVQKSRCKNVAEGDYKIKLVDDEALRPYNNKVFLVQLGACFNDWTGGLWVTQSVSRYSEDTGLFNLISHADGHWDKGDFKPSKQMAREVLASCLYHFKKRENNEKR